MSAKKSCTGLIFILLLFMILLIGSGGCGDGGHRLKNYDEPASQDLTPEPEPAPIDDESELEPIENPEPEPEKTSYIVKFDSDGGTEVEEQNIKSGDLVIEPEDPSKDGFTFMGWYDDDEYLFNFNEHISEDIVLTAKWAATIAATAEEIALIKNTKYQGEAVASLDASGPFTKVEVSYSLEEWGFVEVQELESDPMLNTAGLIGKPIEISRTGGDVASASITFYFEPTRLYGLYGSEFNLKNLGIVWYDESDDIVKLLDSSLVDMSNNTVSVKTDHFSKYGVVSISEWNTLWNKNLPTPVVRTSDMHYNISLLIDCSGSMYGSKMTNTIASAQNLIDALFKGDCISIIKFEYSAAEVLGLTKLDDNNRDEIKAALFGLIANGGTNISAALRKALEYKIDDASYKSFIILLSDGQDTVSSSLLEQVKDNGQTVLAVGVGSDVSTSTMERIADSTGGSYFYASDASQISTQFEELADNKFGSDKDADGDGISDKAETDGVRDQFGYIYKLNPNNADTDGDSINDDMEIGVYNPDTGNFRKISDPNLITYIETKANISISNSLKRNFNLGNSAWLVMTVKEIKYKKDQNGEHIYPSAENLNAGVNLPNDNYKLEELKINKSSDKNKNNNEQNIYTISAHVSYNKEPDINDKFSVQITADNIASPLTKEFNFKAPEIEPDKLKLDWDFLEKIQAAFAVLEKSLLDELCDDINKQDRNINQEYELRQKLNDVKKNIVKFGGGTVPDDVYEAFALAIVEAFDNDGAKIEKYKTNHDELVKQIAGHLANAIKNVHKKVVVNDVEYELDITLANLYDQGANWAYVSGGANVQLVFTKPLDEIKESIAEYCAKLAELNKDLWNDFMVSYVKDGFDLMGIKVKKSTIEKVLKITEKVIRALCGERDAVNELLDELKSDAKDRLKISGWFGNSKFKDFIKTLPRGEKFISAAEKLKKSREKIKNLNDSITKYKSWFHWPWENPEADAEKTFEDIKTMYNELQNINILDGFQTLGEWPKGW